MKAFFLKFLAVLVIFWSNLEAKPPELTPKDTRVKIEEILKAHVNYHQLNPELIRRSFQNYLEELDPGKTYFTEAEIHKWLSPSDDLIEETLKAITRENFVVYESIHQSIEPAIERRNVIEQRIAGRPLPSNVHPSEFKELKWAKSEEELEDRLLRIRSLQLESAEKLSQETKNQFTRRLEKRRLNREEELITKSPKERSQLVLAFTLKAVSSALDSQTAYFTPAEANQFMIQVQQRLFGIGAQLRDDLNGFTVVRLLEGSPASLNGKLKVGDKVIAVNQEPVVGMEITEAVEHIRGPKGTPVILTVLREIGEEQKIEEKIDIELIRGEVVLKETRLETQYEPFGDGVIAILHLFSFYQDSTSSSASDLANAIAELQRDHRLKGIILDLRTNAGGLLPQAVAVSGLFIKKGIVVSVKDNTGIVQHLRNIDGKVAWDGPLIVLTNKASASASEIVAGSLQDYGRALIVGDMTTYGKGTFQTFTLESAHYGKVNPKGEYKVTRGRYYTVSGKSPQLVGVYADIMVPGHFSNIDIGEKFSRFPLENDQIAPNFEDDLADVPLSHRAQIVRLYKFNLQPVLTTYKPYIELLKKNSTLRMEQNKNYQNFLKEIAKKDDDLMESTESYGQADLQLIEACNIMKDLIILNQEAPSSTEIEAPTMMPTGTSG